MTEIFAKVFALYYLIMGLLMLCNPKRLQTLYSHLHKEQSVLFLAGVFALFLGAFMISAHNIWTQDLTVLITVIGYLIFVKGALLVCFENFSSRFSFFAELPLWAYRVLGAICLGLSALLKILS